MILKVEGMHCPKCVERISKALAAADIECKVTLETKTAWFFSRSRQKLWNKGESSGHFLHIVEVYADCDDDTLLYIANPVGPTCHTGETSCFFKKLL